MNVRVAKVGGSLFSMPDLGAALERFFEASAGDRWLIVAGGGAIVAAIREHCQRVSVGDVDAHWLAIRGMGLQARLLAASAPAIAVADSLDDCHALWSAGRSLVALDPFAELASQPTSALPASWNVTSDSIAGYLRGRVGASQLSLLKSVGGGEDLAFADAVARGWLDPFFANVAGACEIDWINLRAGRRCRLYGEKPSGSR